LETALKWQSLARELLPENRARESAQRKKALGASRKAGSGSGSKKKKGYRKSAGLSGPAAAAGGAGSVAGSAPASGPAAADEETKDDDVTHVSSSALRSAPADMEDEDALANDALWASESYVSVALETRANYPSLELITQFLAALDSASPDAKASPADARALDSAVLPFVIPASSELRSLKESDGLLDGSLRLAAHRHRVTLVEIPEIERCVSIPVFIGSGHHRQQF